MQRKAFQKQAALMKNGYILQNGGNGAVALTAASLEAFPGLNHAFSTRCGGVSQGPYASMNLSFKRPEAYGEVMENYRRFCEVFSFPYGSLCTINYEHGAKVMPVDRSHRGRGFPGHEKLPFCDGLVTDDPEVTLVSSHADCGALFFYDPVKRACGMSHAGWKGTLLRIGSATVEQMARCYGSHPEDIIAVIGPCIGKNNYEVDLSLGERFLRAFENPDILAPGRDGKAYLDIAMAAAIQLLEAGIPAANITMMDVCTFANPELFYSHRRDQGITGSMSGFIKLG